jgi:hypothetical protein
MDINVQKIFPRPWHDPNDINFENISTNFKYF